MSIVILGAGAAGLSAARHLKEKNVPSVIYEKTSRPGGLSKSVKYGAHIFDYGVHILHSKNKYVRDLLIRPKSGFIFKDISIRGLISGYWIGHEPQNNLNDLTFHMQKAAVRDFISARKSKTAPNENYRQWCYRHFGRYISDTFMLNYMRKFWLTDPGLLTTDWIGGRFWRSDLRHIVDGMLGLKNSKRHYVTSYGYPKHGGFSGFISPLIEDVDIKTEKYPVVIDPQNKSVIFNDGSRVGYTRLISSIPLPELIGALKDPPGNVTSAAASLKWTSLLFLNFFAKGSVDDSCDLHYYYDRSVPYTRICYMSKLSPNNAPRGRTTLQAEIPFLSGGKTVSAEKVLKKVVACVSSTEKIKQSNLKYLGATEAGYAYVVFDKKRSSAVSVIHGYLDKLGIIYCGRFGRWDYSWLDAAILSGRAAARNAIKF